MAERYTRVAAGEAARAAVLLAHLPDTDEAALVALAVACVNGWRLLNRSGAGAFSLSVAAEALVADALDGAAPAAAAAANQRQVWRALAALAAACAGDGDDPTRGAVRFHHGNAAPDWALEREPLCWIGRWAFYGEAQEAGAT